MYISIMLSFLKKPLGYFQMKGHIYHDLKWCLEKFLCAIEKASCRYCCMFLFNYNKFVQVGNSEYHFGILISYHRGYDIQ